jgi:uncharacterized protein (TIGR03000 family)
MFTIVLSLALTGVETAPVYYPYAYPTGYARYGGYGSFCDGYADWDPHGTMRNPCVLPFAFYPCVDCGSSKEKEALQRKIEEMKYILGKLEMKQVNLEEKFSVLDRSIDALGKKQAEAFSALDSKLSRQLEDMDRRHTEMIKGMKEEQTRKEEFRALEARIDEKFNQGLSRIEKRLSMLELRAGKKEPSNGETSKLDLRMQSLEALIREHLAKGNGTFIRAAGDGPKGSDKDMLKRALVIVQCPADARLYLDNLLTAGGTNLRTFYTPELERGVNYYYTLRVEVPRDGRVLTESQRVYFQAGREVRVSFEHLNPDPSRRVEFNQNPSQRIEYNFGPSNGIEYNFGPSNGIEYRIEQR